MGRAGVRGQARRPVVSRHFLYEGLVPLGRVVRDNDGMADIQWLEDALGELKDSQAHYADSVTRFVLATHQDSRQLWDEIADLRDDLHAVSNRVESLMRAVMADPKDVADAILRAERGDAA